MISAVPRAEPHLDLPRAVRIIDLFDTGKSRSAIGIRLITDPRSPIPDRVPFSGIIVERLESGMKRPVPTVALLLALAAAIPGARRGWMRPGNPRADDAREAAEHRPHHRRRLVVSHAGAYGDRTVSTPNFDRVAREGVLFTQAFTAAPSCTPSRAALLTGQVPHRLECAGTARIPAEAHAVYPDPLEESGYVVGFTGKGWGPGRFEPGGRSAIRLARCSRASTSSFSSEQAIGRSVTCSAAPIRTARTTRVQAPRAVFVLDRLQIPAFLPDTSEVRNDLLDYYFGRVQRFDRQIGQILETLERSGDLERTVIVVTSDNGMPFPRAKVNVHDAGARVSLAIRGPGVARAGRAIESFVRSSRSGAHLARSRGIDAASRDDRTHAGPAPAW